MPRLAHSATLVTALQNSHHRNLGLRFFPRTLTDHPDLRLRMFLPCRLEDIPSDHSFCIEDQIRRLIHLAFFDRAYQPFHSLRK